MEETKAAASFPWPWRDVETRRVTLLAVVWVALLNLWGLLAIDFFPITRHSPWEPAANQRAPLFARYDSGWYDAIVRFGYREPPPPGQPSAHAFFPLYPETARYVHLWTGLESFESALLVTYIALLFALPLFLEESRLRLGEARRLDGLPFLFLYPVAFFLAAVYTESLYLLLVLLAFREVRKDRAWTAVLLGLLAGLTRAPAAAVGPALGLAWLLSRSGSRRWWAVPVALAPVVGVAAWIFGIGLAKGEPGLFFRSMGAWRHSLAADAAAGPAAFVQEAIDQWRSGHLFRHPGAFAPYVHFVLFSCVGAVQLWLRRWADAAWSLGVVALSIATGTSAGIPRYTLTVFPGILLLAELLGTRPRLRFAFLAATTLALLVQAAFFVNWHFVS